MVLIFFSKINNVIVTIGPDRASNWDPDPDPNSMYIFGFTTLVGTNL